MVLSRQLLGAVPVHQNPLIFENSIHWDVGDVAIPRKRVVMDTAGHCKNFSNPCAGGGSQKFFRWVVQVDCSLVQLILRVV